VFEFILCCVGRGLATPVTLCPRRRIICLQIRKAPVLVGQQREIALRVH
jgi:hypothetical protein